MAARPTLKWTPGALMDDLQNIIGDELRKEGKKAIDEIRTNFSRGVSTPGKPPGIQSGELSRGLQFVVIRSRRTLLIGVDTGVTYALALEMGAPSRGLRARPYLRPQRMRSTIRLTEKLQKRLAK